MPPGDIYATASALFWSFSMILMRVSGFRIPPFPLTFFKNCVAVACMAAVLLLPGGTWLPVLEAEAWLRLVVSAGLGISLADTMIAAALNRLGASLQALADCAYAPSVTLVGLLMFGETLSAWELMGGALVVSGVFVGAAMTPEVKKPRDLWTGIVLAASAHVIMAVGILMVRDIYRAEPIAWVTGFRLVVASLLMVLWAVMRHPKSLKKHLLIGFVRRDTWKTTIPMAVLGPFLATLCWVAGFKYLAAGRAAIFNQLSTVFIIILAYFILKEGFTVRKVIGTILALIGSALVATH